MVKTLLYTYVGTNGTITSPIHLENIFSIKSYKLEAEANKMLTRDGTQLLKEAIVPESEVDLWKEVYTKVSSK
jgi:hypothetical protein